MMKADFINLQYFIGQIAQLLVSEKEIKNIGLI